MPSKTSTVKQTRSISSPPSRQAVGTGNKPTARPNTSRADAGNSSSRTSTIAARSDRAEVSREAQRPEPQNRGIDHLLSGVRDWSSDPAEQTSQQAEQQQQSGLELGEGQTLRQNADGQNPEQVTQLQEMLRAGGQQIDADGVFGPQTAEAVRRFQRDNNLTVDGVVGPQTLAALNGGSGTERAQGAAPSETGEAAPSGAGETSEQRPGATSTTRLEGIPDRAEDAMGGREFMESIAHLESGPQRDQAILDEILGGNIPDASRNLQELVYNQNGREIRLHAMPDYLAIGSNEDNVRVPMTPGVAQAIADRTGTSLPTDGIVDAIHSQAQQLHMPTRSSDRGGIRTYMSVDQSIDEQLGTGAAPANFVSGHKKDMVIPHSGGTLAIYGGRYADGRRIQRYNVDHDQRYEDYSHGARLVSQQIMIDGQPMQLSEALQDPNLARLFTQHRGSFSY